MKRALALAALLAVAACSKSNSGGTGPGPTGSLDVTITAPAGVSAKVSIITPNDSVITISSSQTVNGLAPGDYVVRAGPGVTADPIVSIAYTGAITGSPATVTAGQTANATVTYTTPRASSGILWVANAIGYQLSGFSSSNLSATGAPAPATRIGSGTSGSITEGGVSIAVDSSGGIWYANNSDTLRYYAAALIASPTNAAPTRRLISTSLQYAIALAFDAAGDLWVADQAKGQVSKFTPSQLAAGGAQTPTVVLSNVFGTIKRPWQIAFDSHGNLWVASYGDSSISGFSPSQIAASGSPLPFAGISGSKGISDCLGIAFDAQGNLWVGTLSDTISKFTPDQLTSVGSPTPSVILKVSSSPIGMAFDNSGALWVAGYENNKLMQFTPSQLTTTGSPTPTITISNNGNSISVANGITFSPAAPNLPIR